jgi:GNAT superfamily N-acetyltransferase
MTPGGPVVRAATESDLPRVAELMNLGGVTGRAPRETPDDLEPYRRALRDIEDGSGGVLVAELGGEVVGVCQLIVFRHLQARGGLCAEIESVHVHPMHRSCGIGTMLMRAVMKRAQALGCYRVQLTSNEVRHDAHRFYERLGFTPSHSGFKLALDRAAAEADAVVPGDVIV